MSYDYASAESETQFTSVGGGRRIYQNGTLSRTMTIWKIADGSFALRYKPRSDVKASKYRYDLITYYSDRKIKINIDDLPVSPNLVRILNDFLPEGINAILRGGSILISGNYYLSPEGGYLGEPSLTLNRLSFGWRKWEPDDKVTDWSDDTESDNEDDSPEFDYESEIKLAREKAGLLTPKPDNFPSSLAWNDGSLKPPYDIPIIEVTDWEDATPDGWNRSTSRYLRSPADLDFIMDGYPDRGLAIIVNTDLSDKSQSKVIAVYDPISR